MSLRVILFFYAVKMASYSSIASLGESYDLCHLSC